jgi:hypothetical protein
MRATVVGRLCYGSYSVNDRAVRQAQRLIDARQYVLDSDWGEVQPRAAAEKAFLESHTWDDTRSGISGSPTEPRSTPRQARLRLRRLPSRPPDRPDRLRVSGCRMHGADPKTVEATLGSNWTDTDGPGRSLSERAPLLERSRLAHDPVRNREAPGVSSGLAFLQMAGIPPSP